MKKILSALMILTLLALCIATYFNSTKTETIYKAQLEHLNQIYAGFIAAELINYQRGLLVSEVTTNLTVQNEVIPLQHQIRHFPWKTSIETRLAENSAVAERLAEVIGNKPLVMQTDVMLDGSSQTKFELAELQLAEDKLNLLLSGLSIRADLDSNLSGNLFMTLNSLQLAEQGKIEMNLSDIKLESEFVDQQGLPLGRGVFSIGQLAVMSQKKRGFELNQLSYIVNSEIEGDKLATSIGLNFDSLEMGGEKVTAGALELALKDIDAQVIREMQETSRQLQAEMMKKKVDPLVLQLQLFGFYSQLFEKGLTLSLSNLSLEADGGQLKGLGQLQLQGLDLTGGAISLLNNLDGHVRLEIDKAVFNAGVRMIDNLENRRETGNLAVQNELAEQLAGGLIQKGIFTLQEAGHYQIDFSLKDGLGNLNGSPFRF